MRRYEGARLMIWVHGVGPYWYTPFVFEVQEHRLLKRLGRSEQGMASLCNASSRLSFVR
jgi:hypothetical protein